MPLVREHARSSGDRMTAFALFGLALISTVAGAIAPSALAKPGGRLSPAFWQLAWKAGYPVAILAAMAAIGARCGGAP